jgi:hypothetical protein
MNNTLSMTADFERQKNIKASAITFGVAAALLLIFILVRWQLPEVPEAPTEEFIEINLGSGDLGSGDDQPMLPGEPAPAEQVSYTPPQPVPSKAVAEDVKDIETDDRPDNTDAPAIRKPVVAKPNATKIDDNTKIPKPSNTTTPQPVVQAPPKPKAVLGRTTGGNGNGGNGADSYKPGTGEGIAGGAGDQGRPGGSPTGTSYTGTPKNFGVRVLNIPNQSFEDDFNQNAKIAVQIEVDPSGKITSAAITQKGSSGTATASMKNTALRMARQLKMGTSDGGQKGIVVFDFKVRG